MKRIVCLLLLVTSLFWFVSAQTSVDPMNLPKLTQWVNDFSHTLTADQLSELNAIGKAYEDATTNQVVVVLFPSRNDNVLQDIGMKIFTDNGIGQKDKNNGLLLSIATDEKKIRINVGYGLEGVYPDLMASQVIENDIRPLVNSGDIAGAIKVFYERSKQIIWWEIPAGYTTVTSVGEKKDDSIIYIWLIIGFFLWMGLKRFLKGWFKTLKKPLKKRIGIWLTVFFVFAFLAGMYIAWTFLLMMFFGLIFGVIGIIPWFGGFFGGFGGGGWFGWWGWFSGGGGSSWGGGAGD